MPGWRSARWLAFTFSALMLHCGQSQRTLDGAKPERPGAAPPTPGEPGLCSDDAWCWENPTPQGHALYGIWTAPSGEVWAVGERGTILRRGGERWLQEEQLTAHDLYTVWGAGDDDIWAAGEAGTILHYDGSSWESALSPTTELLWSISGAGDQAWAVGWSGTILHLRDGSWSLDPTRPPLEKPLYAVWALSPTDVYAAGTYSRILHFDGQGWQTVHSSESFDTLTGIWARGSADIHAVGGKSGSAGAHALHYDGEAWTEDSPSGVQLQAIHGSAGADTAWALARDGLIGPTTVWRVEGTTFTSAATFEAQYNAVTSSDRGGVWAAGSGGALLHEEQGDFTLGSSTVADRVSLSGAWAAAPDDIWAVGSGGTILHFDGERWTRVESNTKSELSAVHGTGPSDIWAVGRDGVVQHYAGESWAPGPPAMTELWYTAVLASAPDDVWLAALTSDGGSLHHFDGATWSRVNDGPTVLAVRGFWSTAPDDVWALAGRVYHFDGGSWTQVSAEPAIYAMWGMAPDDAWMVGDGGVIQRFDGERFVPQPSPVSTSLFAIHGVSNQRIYAVGEGGVILHYDGQSWRREGANSFIDFRSVLVSDEHTARLFTDGTGILKQWAP